MEINHIASKVNIDYTHDAQEALLDFKQKLHLTEVRVTPLELGETNTIKYLIDTGDRKYFLKCGEKVDVEIIAYQQPEFQGPLFLSMLSHTNNALIIPYYEGKQLTHILNDPAADKNYYTLWGILNTTATNLWLKHIHTTSQAALTPREYVSIRQVAPNTVFGLDGEQLTTQELYTQPVQYTKNGRMFQLPSMSKMIENTLSLFDTFPQQTETCILGDYQPTNILIKENQFKIIDISNTNIKGDIAMDLGKFFNFLDRFYVVTELRDTGSTPVEATVSLKSHGLNLIFNNPESAYIINLRKELEERFIRLIITQTQDYTLLDRIKLYKVITNYITINRHLKHKNLAEYLFGCLADSYLELQQTVIEI